MYDPTIGRFLSEDPLGLPSPSGSPYSWASRERHVQPHQPSHSFDVGWRTPNSTNGGDSNLYRYVHNSPTNYTDPSGYQGIAPGQFDEGRVSFPMFQKLQETQDIFALKKAKPGQPAEQPLSLMQLLARLNQGNDFSKPITLDKAIVKGLKGLGYSEFAGTIRLGLDVQIRADFNKGVDPNRYFWSQIVEVRASSTNAAFAKTFNLTSLLPEWDGGYAYQGSQRDRTSLTMFDTPTLNLNYQITPIEANGTWTFAPPKQLKAYDAFKNDFNKFNTSYETLFTTQLRRFRPGMSPADLLYAQTCGIGSLVPTGGIPGALGGLADMNAVLNLITEPVGQYTWGYKITSNPFALTPIAPQWQRFK